MAGKVEQIKNDKSYLTRQTNTKYYKVRKMLQLLRYHKNNPRWGKNKRETLKNMGRGDNAGHQRETNK